MGATVTIPRNGKAKTSGREGWLKRNLIWYLFIAPAVIMLLLFMAVPLIQSLELAFYEWNGLRPREYIGIENFEELFDDRFFWGALSHTLTFAIFSMVGTVGIGLLLAMAISRRVWGASIYRFVFYLPVMLPMAVTAALWVRMYETNFGMLNVMLRSVGLEHMQGTWIASRETALGSVIAVAIWQFSGFPMIILLAAIENIPNDLHEAASLDGINEVQRIWHLVLPLIRPVLISISVLQFIFSLKVFDLVWVMTLGGPAESTSVLGTFLYKEAFRKQEYGYASAVAVVMFIVIFTITYVYQRLMRVEAVEF